MPDQTTDQFATISTDAAVVTARLHGPSVGEREGGIVLNQLTAHLEQTSDPVRHVVLGFGDVEFLNSAGIGACLQMNQLAQRHGASTILHAVKPDVRQVLKITGLDRFLSIADNDRQLAKLTKK